MSVSWQDDDPDICDLGMTQAAEQAAENWSSMCVVAYMLLAALTTLIIGLAWLALKIGG